MVTLFSRNTRLVNESDETLKVVVKVDGIFLSDYILIPARTHSYMCYDALGIEYNGGRLVEVMFYVGNRQTEPIWTSDIRDHPEIRFSKSNDGTIAHELVKGSMIQMNGMVILMKGVVKKIKALMGIPPV